MSLSYAPATFEEARKFLEENQGGLTVEVLELRSVKPPPSEPEYSFEGEYAVQICTADLTVTISYDPRRPKAVA